ncbi:hypothetical protein [Micromonospora sp. NPDC004704]
MRDTATPPDDGPSARQPEAPTPQQRAATIREYTTEVLARVEQWRGSPAWHDDEINRRRYNVTVDAAAQLDALPDPVHQDSLVVMVDAIRPILNEWRPSRPGNEQAIYAAVERLGRATGRRQ